MVTKASDILLEMIILANSVNTANLAENKKIKGFSVYDMAVVGVMAAIIFALTYFVKIPIPTPAGQTMLKVANAFCLLAGILFGGLKGGLAAGFGSMLYDLLDPIYIQSAPITFVRFFLMAFICGYICSKAKGKLSLQRMIIGATAGSLFSLTFYLVESVIKKTVEVTGFTSLLFSQTGFEAFNASMVACLPKLITSGINAIIGVVLACLLAPALKMALSKINFSKIKG